MQKKLNLGCGETKKNDYVNLDWQKSVEPDIIHDLNISPYPFPDNYFDLIEASHILEHLDKPFLAMKELHRILKPGGRLVIKVPHFSRGFTHAEHSHGFDITFPLYFDKNFTKSGFFGVELMLEKIRLRWLASPHLLRYMGYGVFAVATARIISAVISFFANLSPGFCSRIWCFWVGGFEEIEFEFICIK
ncbi:MAG: class I SAM-dependent methyltransferase [bacterium]|nr:class I SAM-dependent methyltransferase [bacterium]